MPARTSSQGHQPRADAQQDLLGADGFEAVGLQRQISVEHALHAKYDAYMQKRSPARRAFFVFGKNASADAAASVIGRIRGAGSKVLAGG